MTFGYGPRPVVRGVSLDVAAGEFVTLVGPSGCGKTTLLKLIGGYVTPSAGRIHLRGRDVTAAPPEARRAGMVFQNYALFPHLSARRNAALGLEVRGVPRTERAKRVDDVLSRVGLPPDVWDRRPSALSGGQQQRVALARALAIEPDVLLLDEPLANLDRRLREQLRGELRDVQRRAGVTAVLVTHDQDDALTLSDRVGVMNAGRLLQVGPPAEVYDRPRTPFVADALGDANLINGAVLGEAPGTVWLVRPERVTFDATTGCRWRWDATVTDAAFGWAGTTAQVRLPSGVELFARAGRDVMLKPGEPVAVGIPDGAAWRIPEADDVWGERGASAPC